MANELKEVPKNFSKLNNLKMLNIAFNPAINFKSGLNILNNLENLRLIDLSRNNIDKSWLSSYKENHPNTKVIFTPLNQYLNVMPPQHIIKKLNEELKSD